MDGDDTPSTESLLEMVRANSTSAAAAAAAAAGNQSENLLGLGPNSSTLPTYQHRMPGRHRMDPFLLNVRTTRYYVEPFVFAIGLIGNLLVYLVFTRSRFRKVPGVPYLSGIAVVDNGYLCTFLLTSLTYKYQLPIMSQIGVCQFGTFINYSCLFLSIWYSVAVLVEKFISVYWPLKKASMCTVFRAKVVLICFAVMAIVAYSWSIYFFGPHTNGLCTMWPEFNGPGKVLLKLDVIFALITPVLVIVVLLLLIVVRGCEYYRISSASETFGARAGPARNKASSPQTTLRATEIVFSLVGLIVITHLPNTIAMIVFLSKNIDRVFLRTLEICRLLHFFSFAVKFFVYLAVSSNFRKHFVSLLCGGKDRVLGWCELDASGDADTQRISLRVCGQGQPNANAPLTQSDV